MAANFVAVPHFHRPHFTTLLLLLLLLCSTKKLGSYVPDWHACASPLLVYEIIWTGPGLGGFNKTGRGDPSLLRAEPGGEVVKSTPCWSRSKFRTRLGNRLGSPRKTTWPVSDHGRQLSDGHNQASILFFPHPLSTKGSRDNHLTVYFIWYLLTHQCVNHTYLYTSGFSFGRLLCRRTLFGFLLYYLGEPCSVCLIRSDFLYFRPTVDSVRYFSELDTHLFRLLHY